MLTCGVLDVSKAREQQRGRPTPIRPLVQSYTGEASRSDVGSEIAEDYHPLKGEVSQLDDYWASERDPGYSGSSLPPTTAFSPAQLLALAESTARFEELNFGQKSSGPSSPSSSHTSDTKDFPRGATHTRPRRSRFQRGCRTCRSVSWPHNPDDVAVLIIKSNLGDDMSNAMKVDQRACAVYDHTVLVKVTQPTERGFIPLTPTSQPHPPDLNYQCNVPQWVKKSPMRQKHYT
jgi:hypothetical protein